VDRATVRTRHIAWGTINLGETMSAYGVLRWIEPAARQMWRDKRCWGQQWRQLQIASFPS